MSIQHASQSSNILDILEKILDKGVVIVGDIKVSLADVELLTIKIRLLVTSVDKAREIGLDWWESDPYYSSKTKLLEEENKRLKEELNKIDRTGEITNKKSFKGIEFEERVSGVSRIPCVSLNKTPLI